MKKLISFFLIALGAVSFGAGVDAAAQEYVEVARFKAHWAKQGVAVDKNHFYAIDNTHITKFTHQGDSLTTWTGSRKDGFRHINYGIVLGHKLYCAHSNFSAYPMTSSIEIFDTKTMTHIESISLGIDYGSLTWIIPCKQGWYAFFAHYTRGAAKTKIGTDDTNRYSQLVLFDKKWRKMQGWVLPEDLYKELGAASLSGGILVGDTFYCTGHDSFEMYKLRIPKSGSFLIWDGKIKVPSFGQAPTMDSEGNIWGIIRKDKVVVKGVLKK